ncbi:hypothetical protein KP509_26G064800 [Ceratopteris richardii]|nr:hypothetical protein KP509_26G064800 [Ceratopteris richardii]KAH7297310.1 hypothetical protein KP509_26G064800 [Ceratopteris richardii]
MSIKQLRLFVGTWNVAGILPTENRVMQEWLGSHETADIYVIGFQEIVPLSPGNVLVNDDKGVSAKKWDDLINKALNESCRNSSYFFSCSSNESETFCTRRNSSITTPSSPCSFDGSWFYTCDEDDSSSSSSGDGNGRRHSSADESCSLTWTPPTSLNPVSKGCLLSSNIMPSILSPEFIQIASKQLVGLFVSVWIRRDLYRHVRAVDVSTVSCGIMGYFGNKGSVSVSLSLYETNFCFICSHLKSGDRSSDILRRNSDVDSILRRTRFNRTKRLAALNLPKTILGHDRIIWFGDLNYRITLPSKDLKSLVFKKDWTNLLEKDQLLNELGNGGVLEGWIEGPICFPPTYKFLPHSDVYVLMHHPHPQTAAQKRAPAWCDRILWYGKGLKQLQYTSNSNLQQSDHRPVSAIFVAEVEFTMTKSPLIQDGYLNSNQFPAIWRQII